MHDKLHFATIENRDRNRRPTDKNARKNYDDDEGIAGIVRGLTGIVLGHWHRT